MTDAQLLCFLMNIHRDFADAYNASAKSMKVVMDFFTKRDDIKDKYLGESLSDDKSRALLNEINMCEAGFEELLNTGETALSPIYKELENLQSLMNVVTPKHVHLKNDAANQGRRRSDEPGNQN